MDRERALRTLTFWLRPDFVLRVVNRFERMTGFDRAVALASGALTAVIPLSIVASVVAGQLGGKDAAQRIIDRYDLTGGGADAVRAIFAPPSGTSTSFGVLGGLFLLLTVLSFSRAAQRLFEQAWELPPLSVRNSANGLLWAAGLLGYMGAAAAVHAVLGRGSVELAATLALIPASAVFLVWSGWILSAHRIAWRRLVPFGVTGAGLVALYGVGAAVYLPHAFSSYATRYGVIGAVFAMLSALFCLMLALVVAAAAGREVDDELARIRRGERPADDEVRRQWDALLADVRGRWRGGRLRGPAAARRDRSARP